MLLCLVQQLTAYTLYILLLYVQQYFSHNIDAQLMQGAEENVRQEKQSKEFELCTRYETLYVCDVLL